MLLEEPSTQSQLVREALAALGLLMEQAVEIPLSLVHQLLKTHPEQGLTLLKHTGAVVETVLALVGQE